LLRYGQRGGIAAPGWPQIPEDGIWGADNKKQSIIDQIFLSLKLISDKELYDLMYSQRNNIESEIR